MRRGIRREGAKVPTRNPAPDAHALARRDGEVLALVDREFERAAGLAGDWLVCEAGCADCCHGPFPITRLDVWRLRDGLERLARADPARAAAVVRRARAAAAALLPGFPGDGASGRLGSKDGAALDRYLEGQRSAACPALDPQCGTCELYDARPVACRSYGPPLRFGEEQAAPCRLCFKGADTGEMERCRVAPDPDGREESLLQDLGVAPGDEWETLIAFALEGRARSVSVDR